MIPSKFEPGTEYIIDRSEYIATRETGKLVFVIINADGEQAGKVMPFDFQINDYPETLTVIYRGEGKFEQTQASVLDKIYEIGKTYTFKIWGEKASQGLLLRDEVNGLTHSRMYIPGCGKLKRFTEIECQVTDITPTGLQLHYQGQRIAGINAGYTLETLKNTDRLHDKRWLRIADKVMRSEVLAEARDKALQGDVSWVVMAARTLVRLMPQWLSEAPERRMQWLPRLGYTLQSVVESSSYADAFAFNHTLLRTQRFQLVRTLEQLDYIQRAAQLISSGKAEEMIERTLETMRKSGWVYAPNQRMGILMQVLAMAPGLGHSHTGEVFEIIRTRHNNHDFMLIFGDAFRIMLKTYIESERAAPDILDRGSLREIAEAIAIELLLTSDEEFELWDTHRGTLYTVAALLTGHSGEAPVRKAMLTYCGLNDAPLEFTWDDLHDINRVCYRLLATGRDTVGCNEEAFFIGEKIRLCVNSRGMQLKPSDENMHLRTEMEGYLAADMRYAIQLPTRFKDRSLAKSYNLRNQLQLWKSLREALEDPEKVIAQRSHQEEEDLAVGKRISIIVTGFSPMERNEFECRSTDGRYFGLMSIRDVVPYQTGCGSIKQLFYNHDLPLALPAEAIEELPDGRWRFSLRREVMYANFKDASADRNEGALIQAMVTDTSGMHYKATSQMGYGILIDKRNNTPPLAHSEVVTVKINSVNYRPENWKLYINTDFHSIVPEEERGPETYWTNIWEYGAVALGELLRDRYEPITEMQWQALMQTEQDALAEEPVVDSYRYIKPEIVGNLSFLIEQCSSLQRDDLRQSYTLLNLALILADLSGDRGRSEMLEIQLRLLEMISDFATNGKVDMEQVSNLVERGRRLASTSALLRLRLKETALLASLDNQMFMSRIADWVQRGADGYILKLMKLATAYNSLEGLGLSDVRSSIRAHIHKLLALPTIESKKKRLTVNEDLYHEFKASSVYPPDNHMKPDEYRQGLVIARTVASFLNTEGGTLYIGVDNAGNIIGLDNDFRYISHTPIGEYDIRETIDRYNLYLQKMIRYYIGTTVDGLSLIPDYIDIQYEQEEQLWICRITVRPFKSKAILVKPDYKLYLRRIGETVEVRDAVEKRRFIERRESR